MLNAVWNASFGALQQIGLRASGYHAAPLLFRWNVVESGIHFGSGIVKGLVTLKRMLLATVVLAELVGSARQAWAGLILTSAGNSEKLTLATYASGFPNRGDGLGPIGVGFPTSGGVLISVEGGSASAVYQFATGANGQTAAGAVLRSYAGGNSVGGIASVGSQLYMAEASLNRVIQLNNDGSAGAAAGSFTGNPVGLATDPSNGHLFVSVYLGGIWDLNPKTGMATALSTQNVDGITFDSAHRILYGATADATRVIGLNVDTHTNVFDSGLIPGRPDGTALGFGSLAGNLFVNTNAGTVVEVNLSTLVQTTIADGGSRGDLVAVDPFDNSLFLTQSGEVMRLSAPAGSGFGQTPEPASLTMLCLGALSLAGIAWLRKHRAVPRHG
jgi:hypothetical protein